MKRVMADVVLLSAGLSEEDALFQEMNRLKAFLEEKDLSVCVMNCMEVRGCTGCGKCIKRNRCVIEDDVNKAAACIRDACAVIVCTKVLYGEISESVEKLMIRLMHSASDSFSHTVLAGLFDSRGEEWERSENKIEMYCRRSGAIELMSWSGAEIHHPDGLGYAYEELAWMAACLKKGKPPASEYPRNTDFTR